MRVASEHHAAPRLVGDVHLVEGHFATAYQRGLLLQLAALPRHRFAARPHKHAASLGEAEPLFQERERARELYYPGFARVNRQAKLLRLALDKALHDL